jgi:hypothetical protein
MNMPQDAQSGGEANRWGRETAKAIAQRIGAVPVSETSNEFALHGRLITIRSARKGNASVGVTYDMLDRVDSVLAVFQREDGTFDMYEMSPSLYSMFMRDSKHEGKVGLVSKSDFTRYGSHSQPVQF